MKIKYKRLLILLLLLVPTIVFASEGDEGLSITETLYMEAYVSIFMSVFVLIPLSMIISKDNSKKLFLKLFAIRAAILLFFDFFVSTTIALIDLVLVFVGAFAVFPIFLMVMLYRKYNKAGIATTSSQTTVPTQFNCSKCNFVLHNTDKFCPNCGEPFDASKAVSCENAVAPKVLASPSDFDEIYSLPEDKMLEEFLNKELTKAGVDKSSKLIPSDILKRKKILNIIFSVLVLLYITLIFFHFPVYTYVVGIIILFIFFRVTRKYDLIKYLKKQLQARPSEKISNIVMNVKNTFVEDNSKPIFLMSFLIAIILPLFIFSTPKIIYENVDGGYAVRYYIYGLTNFKTATIPETHNNKKVVSLRGNTFSNMPFLESVVLPDSIVEIRGQAFKNCTKLTEVNMPNNLEYLGGGAFYNAKSITSVELPDTLTYLGGESFYGASSLENVKLSENLTEIRGDSFEYCTSLRSISIPDNVTRIGGHAFYGDTSLSEVLISENSKLEEIGSSAFRQCSSLYNITIPSRTYVNERAFKESPTNVERFGNYNNNGEIY